VAREVNNEMEKEKADRDPAEGTNRHLSGLRKIRRSPSEQSVEPPEISIRQKYESDVKFHLRIEAKWQCRFFYQNEMSKSHWNSLNQTSQQVYVSRSFRKCVLSVEV